MNTFATVIIWFFIAWFALAAIVSIARIGKVAKPTTPAIAAGVVVIDAAFIVALIIVVGALQK